MMAHRSAIDLAASAVDFELTPDERRRLDDHLRDCPSCRAVASDLRRDAAALASLPDVRPPAWVRGVIGDRREPRRAVLLVAAAAALLATVGLALAVGSNLRDPRPLIESSQPSRSTQIPASDRPSTGPTPSVSPSGGLPPRATAATLPLASGSARVAVGPDGGVWVLVGHEGNPPADPSTSTIALLDADGTARPGWPIQFGGWDCLDDAPPHPLAVASDGSLRLVCGEDTESEGPQRVVAIALGVDGAMLPGWPVELVSVQANVAPVMVGDELRVLAAEVAPTDGSTAQSAAWWVIGVTAAGDVQPGRRFEVADAAGNFDVRLAADGVAYRVAIEDVPAPAPPTASVLTAFDLDGVRAGWPITIEGAASHPVVGPGGTLFIVRRLGSGADSRAQTMAIDPETGVATATSDGLPIAPLEDRTGAGARPIGPIVARGGAQIVIGTDSTGQRVFVVDPPLAGRGVAPARLAMPLERMGACDGADIGCGVWRVLPTVGPDGTLYIPESAVGEGGGLSSSSGGTLVAIAPNGAARTGWPVSLPDSMAGVWSVIVRDDGTVIALVAIPQDGGPNLNLLAIGSDGTVRSTTPLVDR
jgi:hypothetical protein